MDKKIEIEIKEFEIKDTIDRIIQGCKRLEEFIELKAPTSIVKREIEMIQYRALSVFSMYDFLKEKTERGI